MVLNAVQSLGCAKASFVRYALEACDESAKEQEMVMNVAGSLLSGTSFTSSELQDCLSLDKITAGTETVCFYFYFFIIRYSQTALIWSFQLTALVLQIVLLLLHHPEVQVRAFSEILQVSSGNNSCEVERLPTASDRKQLPYIDCLIKEAHRYTPTVPLVTHCNSEDDEWQDLRSQGKKSESQTYKIQKGTWVMANVWWDFRVMLCDARP
jgi:hypothetical protein